MVQPNLLNTQAIVRHSIRPQQLTQLLHLPRHIAHITHIAPAHHDYTPQTFLCLPRWNILAEWPAQSNRKQVHTFNKIMTVQNTLCKLIKCQYSEKYMNIISNRGPLCYISLLLSKLLNLHGYLGRLWETQFATFLHPHSSSSSIFWYLQTQTHRCPPQLQAPQFSGYLAQAIGDPTFTHYCSFLSDVAHSLVAVTHL